MREFLQIFFEKEGFSVDTAETGSAAIDKLAAKTYDLVITDLKMPGLSGLDVLKAAKARNPDMAVVMITAYASPESVAEALEYGATDYVNKPFRVDDLKHVVHAALEKETLRRDNIRLRAELGSRYGFANIFGAHESMREVYELIKRVSDTKSNVLILGETGTGKELAAKAIHFSSFRSSGPFVVVNCGAIPDSLWESELFGHKKGAFTGAVSDKKGLFQAAKGGTMFLDEVGEIPLAVQVKLLRAIQERRVLSVGSTQDEAIDVRIIAATHRDLEHDVAQGNFRQDLYYRLNVIAIRMPPLRERRSDIPMLANYFLEKYATEIHKDVTKVASETMEMLKAYNYPGNVRELENILERAVTFETSNVIMPESLPPRLRNVEDPYGEDDLSAATVSPEGIDLEAVVGEFEKRLLLQALSQAGGVKKKAAKLLKISFRSFRYRLQKYGLDEGDE
ncbi:MAG: sigma-54-dependent Fis family transcriptional regulator [Deltaproteobacteria bacterium]|nr:sigma-54-dependent Fis family transcriptional regulator [bacterium]MCB9477374.1 sigma-54-dependent Fis family transcriptional regulator [Deltaproteobacteria bacterium]MCB9478990.1 sigma-54-dependent Fis family transcriptional regulator [Deltaproteobacteria bacterium]MCB9487802.1 sigma-54-dependent Fis family transcriptional regulator [Deltaproteobacteria bacterium]